MSDDGGADVSRMEEQLEARFVLMVEFPLDEMSETPTADTILRITEAWDIIQRRFGKRVEMVKAGVYMAGPLGPGQEKWADFPGNEQMMAPAWEEVKRQRFEIERRGIVENVMKPGTPTHSEFQVWGPVIEELLARDPAGRTWTLKMAKWAPKFNAALKERGETLLVERGNAASRRFLNVVRAVFEDDEIVFNDGSNLYTKLVWKSDLPHT